MYEGHLLEAFDCRYILLFVFSLPYSFLHMC
jgi:hypothetical protein